MESDDLKNNNKYVYLGEDGYIKESIYNQIVDIINKKENNSYDVDRISLRDN